MSATERGNVASANRIFWTAASEIRRLLRSNMSDRAKLDQIEMILRDTKEELSELGLSPP